MVTLFENLWKKVETTSKEHYSQPRARVSQAFFTLLMDAREYLALISKRQKADSTLRTRLR